MLLLRGDDCRSFACFRSSSAVHHCAAAQYIAIANTIKTPASTVTAGMLLISGVTTDDMKWLQWGPCPISNKWAQAPPLASEHDAPEWRAAGRCIDDGRRDRRRSDANLLGLVLVLVPSSAELLRLKQVQKVWTGEPSFCAPLGKAGHVPLEWRR